MHQCHPFVRVPALCHISGFRLMWVSTLHCPSELELSSGFCVLDWTDTALAEQLFIEMQEPPHSSNMYVLQIYVLCSLTCPVSLWVC